jgi:hypothetical protein
VSVLSVTRVVGQADEKRPTARRQRSSLRRGARPHRFRSPRARSRAGAEGDLLLEEKLTHEYARHDYGVAIDVEARKVLPEESAQLRAALGKWEVFE